MKRTRLLFIGIALFVSFGSAIATRPSFDCRYQTQYISQGGGYMYAGEFGDDYICLNFQATCTYYQPDPFFQPNLYLPCRNGIYTPVD
jgi:hypothetical protein